MLNNNPIYSAPLNEGELPLEQAPVVTLANGNDCTPQHFFAFDHTLDSVEKLVGNIEFSANYPVFVSCDNAGVFLQVGVLGYDNYDRSNKFKPQKLVYGRKWRVENNLPTSEVIQTVFLAIKKAREHELREFVTLHDSVTHKTSTPFNCHHDFPLMAANHEMFATQLNKNELDFNEASVNGLLERLRMGGRKITLDGFHARARDTILDFTLGFPLGNKTDEFTEFDNSQFTLVLKYGNLNELLHQLMQEFVQVSDRYVEENFLFNGFARFSRQQDIASIGRFSIQTRSIDEKAFNELSKEFFRQHNVMIDATRVPVIFNEAQRKRLGEVLAND